MVPPELTCNSSRCHRALQSQDEGFALIPPAATTEPSSGAPAGPEDLRFEDARSSGGDADQGFLHEEDLRLEKDFEAYSGRKDFTASDRAGVQENGGSSDKAEGRGKDVEKPTHVMEEELANAQEETREAKQKALAMSANHEKVKQNLHQAENAFQNAGGEFAADAIAVAQEAEAADTPTSVPESVGEVGEEGDAQKNEEREEQAEGAAEGDGSADEKNEEREEEAEGAEAGDGSAAELNEEKEEEAVGAEQEKEVAEVMAGEVGAAPGRPQREGKGVIAKRYSDSSFKPPRGIVKPVAQSSSKKLLSKARL